MNSNNNNILDSDDVRSVVQRYQQRVVQHGISFDSLNSGSPEKQRIRHTIHASTLQGECPVVLDIGCGLADFYVFLQQQGRPCKYYGYDIVPEYIQSCAERFPEAIFKIHNFIEQGIEEEYDSIVMSQVLNNHFQNSDNIAVMKEALRIAYNATRISVSVDMLSTYVDFQNSEVFYYQPEEIFRFAKSLTPRVCLRHDYRPYEFCIQLFHPEATGFVK